MSLQKLKHCPFCGSKMVYVGASKEFVTCSSVYCNQCGLEATWYNDNDEEAAVHWNRRTSVDEAENERLKEIDHQIFQLKAERDDILTKQALRKEKQNEKRRRRNLYENLYEIRMKRIGQNNKPPKV